MNVWLHNFDGSVVNRYQIPKVIIYFEKMKQIPLSHRICIRERSRMLDSFNDDAIDLAY